MQQPPGLRRQFADGERDFGRYMERRGEGHRTGRIGVGKRRGSEKLPIGFSVVLHQFPQAAVDQQQPTFKSRLATESSAHDSQ
jgi:hypothetical protein